MELKRFIYGDAEYEVYGDSVARFQEFKSSCSEFEVPQFAVSPQGKKYKIIGFRGFNFVSSLKLPMIISFNESSEIKEVPTNIFDLCTYMILLPKGIKRVKGVCQLVSKNSPIIIPDDGNRFVSVIGKDKIMNNFPLEVLYQHRVRSRFLTIRETVRIIGCSSFLNNERITSVVIPSSVEVIGDHSFERCVNLQSIKFKNNSKLRSIGINSFSRSSIERIIIPNAVERIGHYAFNECKKLRSVDIYKDSVLKEIGNQAFNSSAIEYIFIPLGVTIIRQSTFFMCNQLRSVSLHEDTKLGKIEPHAFKGCTSLISIPLHLASSLIEIGNNAFESSKIESLLIPTQVQNIGYSSFYQCESLVSLRFLGNSILKEISMATFSETAIETIVFPSSVEVISEKAFETCHNLMVVSFPEDSNLREIGPRAFSSTKIESICIPQNVEMISDEAFRCCQNLNSVSFHQNSKLKIIKKHVFVDTKIESLCIPSSVEVLMELNDEDHMNEDFMNLKSITFPKDSKLRSIEDRAFRNTPIQSIVIPSSVEVIGEEAFQNCDNLEEVTFYEDSKLGIIKANAFEETRIRTIDIPSTVVEISEKAFNHCLYLETITFHKDSMLKTIGYTESSKDIKLIDIPPIFHFYCFMDVYFSSKSKELILNHCSLHKSNDINEAIREEMQNDFYVYDW